MEALTKFYRLINLLSIDVAAGAVVNALFLSSLGNVALPHPVLFCLGLCVWIIYTGDHLIDAKKIRQKAESRRHRFHQLYFGLLSISVIVIAFTIVILLTEIPKSVLMYGSCFFVLVMLYFFFQQKLYFLKEFFGAILYSGGVLLPSIAIKGYAEFESDHYFIIALFATTTLINLILFSWFDREQDKVHHHKSMVSVFGERFTSRLVWVLLTGQTGACLFAFILMPSMHLFIGVLLAMNAVLFLIFFKKEWFAINDRYRLLGDAIFFLPVVTLLISA